VVPCARDRRAVDFLRNRGFGRVPGFFPSFLAENYTKAASEKPNFHAGRPIRPLRKVEDHVSEHLAGEISVEALAEVAGLSPFHFSRVFKQTTGMAPHQFVTGARMLHAQRLIRETSHSLIEIALATSALKSARRRRSSSQRMR
jgi:AraC-like DNA-binding protein